MSVLDLFGVPAVRIKAVWATPVRRVLMNGRKVRNEDRVFGYFVSAGQYHVFLGVTTCLKCRTMHTHCLLDEFVKVGHRICKLGCPFCLSINTKVDKFLKKTVLHVRIRNQAVDKPGEESRNGSEARTKDGKCVGKDQFLGKFIPFLVRGACEVIN